MKLVRCRHGKAEEAAEVSVAADANVGNMAHIHLHEGESIENALRRFKRKVLQEDIIKETKKHAFYLKPGEKKRVKQALARKRARKKIRRQPPDDR